MTGRVLGASGFLLVFWVADSEKPVGPNSGYLYNGITFIESKGDRVEGVQGSRG